MQLGPEHDRPSKGSSDWNRLKPSMKPYPYLTKTEQNPGQAQLHLTMLK